MTYKIIVFILFVFVLSTGTAQINTEEVSLKIATRMRDSLSLSNAEYDSVLYINRRLHAEKMEARKSFPSFDSLTRKIQRIELQRDSLYRSVLFPGRFDLYIQKKRNLIHNNR